MNMLGMLDTKYLKCVLNVYIFFKKNRRRVRRKRVFFARYKNIFTNPEYGKSQL